VYVGGGRVVGVWVGGCDDVCVCVCICVYLSVYMCVHMSVWIGRERETDL